MRVRACGVCRTDLHLAEGDLAPRRPRVTPGHEVVGVVDRLGPGSTRWREGDRIGVPWLAHTCGICRFCTSGRENLCLGPRFTGWDVDGGYADYAVVDEAYAYALPDEFDDVEVAPLLCAGIIGYRALLRANLPEGGRLGIYGFGGSAHLTAQVALARGARVHVMTRSPRSPASWPWSSAPPARATPTPRHPSRSTPPSCSRRSAPWCLRPWPRWTAAARWPSPASTSATSPSSTTRRHLFEERTLQSVTANTRRDGEEFLAEAARIGFRVSAVPYPMERADDALRDLHDDRVNGAAVLVAVTARSDPRDCSILRQGKGPRRTQKRRRCPSRFTSKRCHRALGDRSWSFRLGHARRQCDQAVDRFSHYSRSADR